MRQIEPLRAVIICNADVPWSGEMAPWWASLRGYGMRHANRMGGGPGIVVTLLKFPFGTSCLSAASGSSGGTYVPPSNQYFYDNLIKPASELAREFNAGAIFMGPATPMYVTLPARSNNTPQTISLPPIFATAHAQVRMVDELGCPLPRVFGPTLSFDDIIDLPELGGTFIEPGLFCYASNMAKYYDTRTAGNSDEFQGQYGQMLNNSSTGWPGLPRIYKGLLGRRTEDMERTFGSILRKTLDGEPLLVGRIGRPVFHRQALTARQYMGDETPSACTTVLRGALANELDIAGHRDKPLWFGISQRNTGMTDQTCMAAVDIARRAGFTNVNYFTRTIANPAIQAAYAPISGRAFTYAQIPAQQTRDCFLYFGYALHNEVPGRSNETNSNGDLLAVQGTDVDRLFNFLPGSLSFAGTSFPARHVMRCLRGGGAGGISCEFEPGFRAQPQTLLYNLLKGCTLAETLALTNEFLGDVPFPVGDPLYAPFRYEQGIDEDWYAAVGTPPFFGP